jgi:hypothetical protein
VGGGVGGVICMGTIEGPRRAAEGCAQKEEGGWGERGAPHVKLVGFLGRPSDPLRAAATGVVWVCPPKWTEV